MALLFSAANPSAEVTQYSRHNDHSSAEAAATPVALSLPAPREKERRQPVAQHGQHADRAVDLRFQRRAAEARAEEIVHDGGGGEKSTGNECPSGCQTPPERWTHRFLRYGRLM